MQTGVSYQLFLTIIGTKIDTRLIDNHGKLDTQAGFTTGSMIEDNLLTLQYVLYRKKFQAKRPLMTIQKHLILFKKNRKTNRDINSL